MKTRTELLAQLEAEQAAGDPQWGGSIDATFTRLIEILAAALLEHDNPTVVHLHARRNRAA